MDFRLRDKLELNGFDIEYGLGRYFNSDEVYFNALKDFIKDDLYSRTVRILVLDERLAISNLIRLVTLTKNLGLNDFSNNLNQLVESLRIKREYSNLVNNLNEQYFVIKNLILGI